MNEEINIRQIFSEFVHFNKRNKNLIFVFILLGIISVILFQNLKPAYYETKTICMSGISEYERLEQLEELSQRTAVDLINYLQINVSNKDYGQLSELLGISKEMTEKIKSIEAEQLYQQDMNEKYYALNKFEILLTVFDNTKIPDIQRGLIYYFNDNNYVKSYHDKYTQSNTKLIRDIENEIELLKDIRIEGAKNSLDISSVNIISGKDGEVVSNQIILLSELREELKVKQDLLQPLVYVQEFASVDQKEDDILVWGLLGGLISFLFGLLTASIIEVK